jgi:hypothetical protein
MDDRLESWKLAMDLTLRDYEHTVTAWPATLREKGIAFIQLYIITLGAIPSYLGAILNYAHRFGSIGLSGNVTCGSIVIFLSIATFIAFILAWFYIRNVIFLRHRNTFDSAGVLKLLDTRDIMPEDLYSATSQRLHEYIEENSKTASELSNEIQRSYRYYFIAIFLGLGLHIFCILS